MRFASVGKRKKCVFRTRWRTISASDRTSPKLRRPAVERFDEPKSHRRRSAVQQTGRQSVAFCAAAIGTPNWHASGGYSSGFASDDHFLFGMCQGLSQRGDERVTIE